MSLSDTAGSRGAPAGFGLVLFALLVMMAGASAPSPFYPVLQQEFGFSPVAMTGIFAVYAVTLLITLLCTGSLSDHLGRRPVLSGAFALLSVSILIFWQAGGTGTLLLARALQGVASGLLLSTLSAAAVDLEPKGRPGLAAIATSVVPLGGLALGSLAAGLVLDFAGHPEADVFGCLVFLYLALAGLIWFADETSPRHGGVLASLRPHVAIPARARGAFWRSAPAVFAGWATGGLYLSLGAPLVEHVFGVADKLVQAVIISILAAAGAGACFAARGATARAVTLYGTTALALGTALTLVGVALASLPFYAVAVAIAGTGFGTCFYGVMRSIIPLAQEDERGGLFAALFTLSYTAFGVPVVLAGLLVPHAGLGATFLGYGGVIVLFAAAAGLWRRFGTRE
ncbi:MFS transporter [Pseudoroseicyclus aestuarii]|uniref:Putative MFS family arabinose efflux permease n=1 Tax=Pseudoroseicyclus aestuarii TaxID=1795041 RepID=A0A318SS98_9RHOB|nr:MFS transporter [Pseudoroseicyclus aestuarii]PYE81399.1 putative MFS family arabinose efflux permease [Pseudoroseicyclus aestuarii]